VVPTTAAAATVCLSVTRLSNSGELVAADSARVRSVIFIGWWRRTCGQSWNDVSMRRRRGTDNNSCCYCLYVCLSVTRLSNSGELVAADSARVRSVIFVGRWRQTCGQSWNVVSMRRRRGTNNNSCCYCLSLSVCLSICNTSL